MHHFKSLIPKNEKVLSFSIILSTLIGLISFFLIYYFFKDGDQVYHDITVGNITWEDFYKSVDYIAIYSYLFSTFLSFLILALVFNRSKYGTTSFVMENNTSNTTVLFIMSFLVYCLTVWFIREQAPETAVFLFFIISIISIQFVSDKSKLEIKSPMIYKEYKQKILRILLTCLFSYFSLIALLVLLATLKPGFATFQAEKINFLFKFLIVLIILFVPFIIRNLHKISINLINRIMIFSQVAIPLLLLILLKNHHIQDGNIIVPYDVSLTTKFSLISLVIMSVAFVIYKLVKFDLNRFSELVFLPTIASITAFKVYTMPAYSTFARDDFHLGELILPWQQIVELNQTLFSEFVSVQGLMGLILGWINKFLLDDSYASFIYSFTYLKVFFGILIALMISRLSGRTWSLLIVLVGFIIMDRAYFSVLILLILADFKLWKNPIKWLIAWNILSFLNVLYIPAFGAAQVFASLPFALLAIYRYLSVKDVTLNKKVVITSIFIIINGVICVILFPVIKGVIMFILDNGSTNTVGYGKGLLQHNLVPNWFAPFSGYPELGYAFWNVVRLGGWVLGISLFLYFGIYSYIHSRQKSLMSNTIYTPMSLALSCIIFVIVIIPYSMGRLDGGTSRTGAVTYLVLGVLLPTLMTIIIQRLKPRVSAATAILLGLILGISSALSNTDLGTLHQKAIEPILVPKDAILVNGKDYDLNRLGTLYVSSEKMEEIINLESVLDRFLEKDETYYDLTNRSALYYILNKKVPVPYSADYLAMNYEIQTLNLTALEENPPPIVWVSPSIRHDTGPASLRSYRIYKHFINNDYRYFEENGLGFLVRNDRYEKQNNEKENSAGIPETNLQQWEEEKLRTLFHEKDLKAIPFVWGRNIENMETRFKDGYTRFDIIRNNQLTEAKNNFRVINSQDPYLIWELDRSIEGNKLDFLELNLAIISPSNDKLRGQIFWKTESRPFDELHSFTFDVKEGPILIPMGSHPSWLKDNITSLRLDIDNAEEGLQFSVDSVRLLELIK